MFRHGKVILSLALIAGCAQSHSPTTSSTQNNYDSGKTLTASPTSEELAAYAGHASYPTTQRPSDELKAAALVTPDRSTIKIYNFGSEPIRNADIWVNGSFVQHVHQIAPHSSVVIRTNQLYNGVGKPFDRQGEPVTRVQIESEGNLYNLMGPAVE